MNHRHPQQQDFSGLEEPGDSERMDVVVQHIVFEADERSYSVIRVSDDDGNSHTAVGPMSHLRVGDHLRLLVKRSNHPKFGEQYQVLSYMPISPQTKEGIEKFLASGVVPGVGKAMAKRIVDVFGEDSLEVAAEDPQQLLQVEGIGKKKLQAIHEAIVDTREHADVEVFLREIGVSPIMGGRLKERLGGDLIGLLREDPFAHLKDVRGMSFSKIDEIAQQLGFSFEDPRRVGAAIVAQLEKALRKGRTHLEYAAVESELLGLQIDEYAFEAGVRHAVAEGDIIQQVDDLLLPEVFVAENHVFEWVENARHGKPRKLTENIAIESELSEEQASAVSVSLRHRLVLLSGGPGTGKTTTLRAVADAHRQLGERVAFCAPTGRAAQRLSESSGVEAKTIHRLLEWNPALERFERNSRNPLEADLVLVDEASMIDLLLASHLIRALPSEARLMLVGDPDQLPPIAAGHVYADLLASASATSIHLTQVFRQAEGSDIVLAASQIREGQMPRFSEREGAQGKGEFFHVPPKNIATLDAVIKRLEIAYGLDPLSDIQVISPARKGKLGIHRINAHLRRSLNPKSRGEELSSGDKVIQLVNDYDRGVFNGDVGFVERCQGDFVTVRFGEREVTYDGDASSMLTHAYAISVHKSQGSEYEAVVVAFDSSHQVMLWRGLFYTAITRAKQVCVVVATRPEIQLALRPRAPLRDRGPSSSRLLRRLQ